MFLAQIADGTTNIILNQNIDLSIQALLISLVLGTFFSLLLKFHYQRFGSSLSNRAAFSKVFPFITLTTILIISVVKSSLALSLGLVGALSIVRFRTPIKEPEELAYLFLCIAIGLGLGANQFFPTMIAGIFIIIIISITQMGKKTSQSLYLSLNWKKNEMIHLEKIQEIISEFAGECDLRRFDSREDAEEVIYHIFISTNENFTKLIDSFKKNFPAMGITFIDQNKVLGV